MEKQPFRVAFYYGGTEMEITFDSIIKFSALLGALLTIGGLVIGGVKWFLNQNKQTADIKELKELHEKDMIESRESQSKEMQKINNELCVVSYAMLAALDGLKQLNCNGEVTKAHDMLEKHLNQKAHNQK